MKYPENGGKLLGQLRQFPHKASKRNVGADPGGSLTPPHGGIVSLCIQPIPRNGQQSRLDDVSRAIVWSDIKWRRSSRA